MRAIIPIVGFAIGAVVVTRSIVDVLIPRRLEWTDVLGGEAA